MPHYTCKRTNLLWNKKNPVNQKKNRNNFVWCGKTSKENESKETLKIEKNTLKYSVKNMTKDAQRKEL